jgi:hypothetical protein
MIWKFYIPRSWNNFWNHIYALYFFNTTWKCSPETIVTLNFSNFACYDAIFKIASYIALEHHIVSLF